MRRLSGSSLLVLVFMLVLTACGGSSASTTNTPGAQPTTGATGATTAPTAAATTASKPATAAGSVAASTAPATASTSGTTAPATTGSATAAATTTGAITPAMLSGEAIPIGISVAQTSNTALLGQDEVNGAKIAEKFFNDRGGVNGRPIKLVYEDTAGDEMGAINAFQAQINKNKVVGIVGPTLSQQALAADPVADKAKVPVIGPSNTADGIPAIGEYVTRVSAPVRIVAPNAIQAALKQNPAIKKVAVFYAQNDAFSVNETKIFQDTAKMLNLDVTTVQKFQTTDTDFQSQATNALATKPDLAIVSGLAADGGNLVKQLRELGFKGNVIGGNGLNTTNIFPVCKAQCDGILIAQAYSYEANTEINTAFRTAYKAQFNVEPPQFAAQTFTGVQVFVEALKTLDSKSKISGLSLEDLRTALNTQAHAGTYTTPLGEISFDKDRELIQKSFYVAQVKMNPDGMTGKLTFVQ